MAHWNLAQQRPPGQAKVQVHNPDFEQHGWRSPHTVIEIVSDDMPFLVDSVTVELSRQGYSIDLMIHPVIRVRRGPHGALTEVLEPFAAGEGAIPEWIMHAEVVRETGPDRLRELGGGIERVLDDVRRVVEDSAAMRGRAVALIDELARHPPAGRHDRAQGGEGFPRLARERPLHVPRLSRVRPRSRGRRGGG